MELNAASLETFNDELPQPEQAFEWARQAMRESEWSEAAVRWSVLRKAYPDHPTPWFQAINSHISAGELDQAEALLISARQSYPNHPGSLIESAVLAMRRLEWETADDLLKQARNKHPDHIQTWMKSAECAEAQGNLEQAAAYYLKACQLAPEWAPAFIQYAEQAMRAEQWEDALKRWEIMRKQFPENATGYHRAADAARRLGNTKEARQLILTHQYGAHIFESESVSHNTPKQSGSYTNLGRLLELIWTKARLNLRSEVHRNYLSYSWWVIEPLLHMVVYYVVFGFLLQRGNENYPVFLLTGLVPWMWFMKAVSGSSGSILAGQNLMLQVGLPSIVFPLVSIVQATLKQIPVFLLLVGFVWLQGYAPTIQWWALLPVIFMQSLLTIAFSLGVAAVIPFIRDLAYLVPTGLTFLMFLSGIFYDYRSISPEWHELFLMNPLAFLLKCYREIFMEGTLPDLMALAWWTLGCTTLCLMLLLAYKRLRYIYPRIVME